MIFIPADCSDYLIDEDMPELPTYDEAEIDEIEAVYRLMKR
jgi:hypothetical protein